MKWSVLSVTSLGALLATLNAGTLVVALPTLMAALRANLLEILWILLAYSLAQTALLLNAGRLSDLFGRRRLYTLGLALFTLAALLQGFIPSPLALILLRGLQGAAGALMMANSAALVADAFPRNELGFALGVNQMTVALGLLLGPVVGGVAAELSWRFVFWFNVPLGLLGTLWALRALRGLEERRSGERLDLAGNLLYALGLFAFTLGLSLLGLEGVFRALPWLLLGLLLLGVFLRLEARSPSPMLDLGLFRYPAFLRGNLANLLNALARQALNFLLVFYFHGAKGMSPMAAGIALTPLALGLLLAAPLAGRLADRGRGPARLGLLLTALGIGGLALALGPETPYPLIAGLLLLAGVGAGLFNSPNSKLILGGVPADRRGVASALRGLFTNLGGILSLVLAMAFLGQVPREVLLEALTGAGHPPETVLRPFLEGLRLALTLMALVAALALPVAPGREGVRATPQKANSNYLQ